MTSSRSRSTRDGRVIIEVKDLTVSYGETVALSNMSMSIERGSFVLVTGPSGGGKSTLALCLSGIIPHASSAVMNGLVCISGQDTRSLRLPLLSQQVGLVFQNPATQIFNATVAEEVAFAPLNVGLPAAEVADRVASSLGATGIAHLTHRSIRSLSAGEQQLVAISSVLALRPQVLILDEPTANLDWRSTEIVVRALARLREGHGITIIVIEHRLHSFVDMADRMILLRDGGLAADGVPAAVLGHSELSSYMGPRSPCYDRVETGSGHRASTTSSGSRNDSALLTLESLEAGYGGRPVLHDVDFAIYPGEFVALVGDNGSGKTTLARIVAGVLRPSRGRIIWNEQARRLPIGRRVGLLFQNPLQQLVCDSVDEEVSLGPVNFDSWEEAKQRKVLEAADLLELRHRRPQELSAGQQQRTALAATMVLVPKLLILDEPTMGQDWGHLSRLMDYLQYLNWGGQSILLITHDDRLVCRYASRIVRLDGGRLADDTFVTNLTARSGAEGRFAES